MLESKFFQRSLKIILVLVIILLGMQVAPLLTPVYKAAQIFIIPAIFAIFLCYVLRPIVNFLEKKLKKRGLAVAITLLLVIGVFGFVFGYGGVQIGNEIGALITELKKILDSVVANEINIWPFEDVIPLQDLFDNIAKYIQGALTNIVPNVASGATDVISTIGNVGTKLFLTLFMTVFFLKDGKLIVDKITDLFPAKHREITMTIRKKMDETLAIYISGQITVSIILGIFTLIGYSVIGLKNAFALAVINLLFNLIPYVGPIIGFIPALIMALSGGWSLILMVIIVAVGVQQLEGNFVSPWILGDKLQIHPLAVVIVITAAISQAGIIGAFAAVPIYSIARVIIKELKKNKDERKDRRDDDIILE